MELNNISRQLYSLPGMFTLSYKLYVMLVSLPFLNANFFKLLKIMLLHIHTTRFNSKNQQICITKITQCGHDTYILTAEQWLEPTYHDGFFGFIWREWVEGVYFDFYN